MKKTKQEIDFIVKNFRTIRKEYKPSTSIFREESWVEPILVRLWQLEEYEINIFILYAEIPSYRKVAEVLGISYGTVKNEMDKIREKLRCCRR